MKDKNLEQKKLINMKFPNKKATKLTTLFPGPLLFPSPGARGERKRRGPGNEVATLTLQTLAICQKKENDGSTFESALVVMNKF